MPFSNGRLVHCPWCDVALDRKSLPPPTNLAGQLSKGNKSAKHSLPSLAAEPDDLQISNEYDAVKLASSTVGPIVNLIKRGPAELVGDASTVNTGAIDLSTIVSDNLTGITDVDSRSDYVDKEGDDIVARRHYKQSWVHKLKSQAFKAKMKSQQATPAAKEVDTGGKTNATKEAKPPTMWESGTGNPKKPSSLCIPAACVLMGILYGARMARYDLIRPVQILATYLHEWDADCDARLNRLVSYVQSTLHWRQVAWVGDEVSHLGPHLYADDDFAGCPRTLRSTSGYHLAIGPMGLATADWMFGTSDGII